MTKRMLIGGFFFVCLLSPVGCEDGELDGASVLARLGLGSTDPNSTADPNGLADPNSVADPNDGFGDDPNDVMGGADPNQVGPGDGTTLRLKAQLTGAGPESGSADYRLEDGRERFSVEIEDATPGTTHDIVINTVTIGSITANQFGFAEIEFDTQVEPGHVPLPANFPTEVKTGDMVFIGNILAGTLAPD